ESAPAEHPAARAAAASRTASPCLVFMFLLSLLIGNVAFPSLVRLPYGGDDALVAGAPAEVAGQRHADVTLGQPAAGGEQLVRRHQHPGGAEPALQGVVVGEGA